MLDAPRHSPPGRPEIRSACPMHAAAAAERSRWVPRDLRRWALAGVGVLATSLAVIGAILPGVPTTIFVIVAAWCFAKSCPVLEEKLLRNRLLGPSMEVIDGTRPFTPKARASAIAMMGAFGFGSIGVLHATDAAAPWVLWAILAAMAAGAVMIVRFRPRPPA